MLPGFEKAALLAFDNSVQRKPMPHLSVDFFLNPKAIRVRKSAHIMGVRTEGHVEETRWSRTHPLEMELGELLFDTYEMKNQLVTPSVRDLWISRLERLLEYEGETHHPPAVFLLWGGFTATTALMGDPFFWVRSMTVDYTMFLPNGTPVRAKVSLELVQTAPIACQEAAVPKQSPDHAKVHVVKRGDTLQGIATLAYDDPREWRRIADANAIDDPMRLTPGQELLVPPILK